MLTETLRFTSVKPNIKIIWWVRLKFPVLSFHGVSSPPPPFRAQQSLLLFCCALQKCVLGWVRAGLPGSSVTAFGSHQTAGKNAYCWGLAAPFTHLEGSPSDSLVTPWDCFFLNRRIIENIQLERTSGGHLVQSPAQSFTITSGCLRSWPAELLKISKRCHSNLGHLFQYLTFTEKNFLKSACPIHIHGLSLFLCLPVSHLSVFNIQSYTCGPSRDVFMCPLQRFCFGTFSAVSPLSGHHSCPTVFQKRTSDCKTRKNTFKNILRTECR